MCRWLYDEIGESGAAGGECEQLAYSCVVCLLFDVIDFYCIFGLIYCAWYFWNWLCNISFVPI